MAGRIPAMRYVVTAVVAGSLAVSGCATMGSGAGGAMTELDKANGRCVAAVLVGALAGAIVGNNVGDGEAGRGAAIGAGAGGLACLIIREAAREKDAILAYQREAAERGTAGREEWVAESGKRMVMSVEVLEDDRVLQAEAGVPQPLCRYSSSTVQIEGMGTAPLGRQRWCRGDDGTWVVA